MIVYHGSASIIDLPVFEKGRPTNDYGQGFYCTESADLAKEWACAKGSDGFASIYQLDLFGLTVLDLNSENHGILAWLAILARYRPYWEIGSISKEAADYLQKNFFVSPEEYDVVCGYRADNSYFTFAKNFVSNEISLDHLRKAMYLGALGEQIVLKSQKAFEQITYTGNLPAKSKKCIKQAQKRDREARRIFQRLFKESTYSTGTFMLDIIREGMTASDPRLQ